MNYELMYSQILNKEIDAINVFDLCRVLGREFEEISFLCSFVNHAPFLRKSIEAQRWIGSVSLALSFINADCSSLGPEKKLNLLREWLVFEVNNEVSDSPFDHLPSTIRSFNLLNGSVYSEFREAVIKKEIKKSFRICS